MSDLHTAWAWVIIVANALLAALADLSATQRRCGARCEASIIRDQDA